MRTDNLQINQLSDDAYQWYLRYLKAIDIQDLTAYGAFLADDCVMRMNSDPPIKGKVDVLASLAKYWPSFASLEHDLLNLFGTDESFALEALNHYTRHDGKQVTLRAVALTDRNDEGKATSIRVYTDAAKLFA